MLWRTSASLCRTIVSRNNRDWIHRKGSFSSAVWQTLPLVKEAKILSLSDPLDDANSALQSLPHGAEVVAVGSDLTDFDMDYLNDVGVNVIFVSHSKARKPLAKLLTCLPSVEWVHARSAGIDFITSPDFASSKAICTNAKGQFSSTLAEYTMMACSYFAKDIPRLIRQKNKRKWGKYNVRELRGT